MLTLLSQRDPRWAQNKLGASSLTVGRYGCTTTAICMGLSAFGISITPDVIASNGASYTADGLILWGKLKLPKFKFVKRGYGRDDAAIRASLAAPDEFVILEVNHSHWVLATGKTLFGNDYKIADPWFGDRSTAVGRYKAITGSAHFKKKLAN